jgi:hypothetical protein
VKRPSLKDRGEVLSLLRGSEPARHTANQRTDLPDHQDTGKPVSVRRSAAKPKRAATDVLVKATFYLAASDLHALEAARTNRRAETGRRRGVDLSALVREAIRARFGRTAA